MRVAYGMLFWVRGLKQLPIGDGGTSPMIKLNTSVSHFAGNSTVK